MKKVKVILTVGVLTFAMIFQSCQKNELDPGNQNENIMPERFKVDIPNSISSISYYKDSNVDTLQGNDIYEHLSDIYLCWRSCSRYCRWNYPGDQLAQSKSAYVIQLCK